MRSACESTSVSRGQVGIDTSEEGGWERHCLQSTPRVPPNRRRRHPHPQRYPNPRRRSRSRSRPADRSRRGGTAPGGEIASPCCSVLSFASTTRCLESVRVGNGGGKWKDGGLWKPQEFLSRKGVEG